ncbi:MAG: molybdopterin-dependent oxidoreductase [Spirochaetaceae bacterium]|nr:MAG: molybdopterin-dependent oxidoreductase [Spirochaetaceae bacterium]
MGESIHLPVSCNKDCGAGCPLMADVVEGRLLRIRDNPLRATHMKGCVRGYQMTRVVYHPQRLSSPLVRSGPRGSGKFREVNWDEALQIVSDGLQRIRATWGPESVLRLGGSGSCRGALHNTALLTRRFLSRFGGYTDITGSYSSGAESFVAPYLFGPGYVRRTGIDAATLSHSRLIVLWGANLADTRFGSELAPRILEQRRRGVPVIAIDPRRSRTIEDLADRWISVLPGTDTALMAAVLYVLLSDDLVDRSFISKCSVGFEVLERYVRGLDDGQPKTPAWARGICATPQEAIVELARRYGRIKPAALIPGLSIQRTIGGEEAIRMSVALQLATGNIGILGGSSGSNVWGRLPEPRCPQLPVPSLPRPAQIPVYCWPDAVLQGKAGSYPTDIKAIYSVGGNYISTGSDVHKNIRAFESVELAISHDYFLTPTACYCDVVLPVTTYLERGDIVYPNTNHLLYSHKVIEPVGQGRNDYDIFCQLADRLGFGQAFSEGRSAEQWLEHFMADSEIPDVDEFRRIGIYTGAEQERCGLSEFVSDPQAHPLDTPSGKIEIASKAYADLGFTDIPSWRGYQPTLEYPLYLITPHARFRINSQYANDPWFVLREKQRLWMNPRDAEARGIEDQRVVEVESPQGKMRIPVRITEGIMPGVVCLLAGMWPRIGADGIETAGAANVLTSTVPTQPSQSSRTHSVAVQVRPA